MVDSAGLQAVSGDKNVISRKDVLKILDVTPITLSKWVTQKKVKVKKIKIGDRVVYGYDERQISKIAKAIRENKKNWKKGKPLF